MLGKRSNDRRGRATRIVFACSVTMAMIVASVASVGVINDTAEARGLAYSGPITLSDGPAHFGPAPNPFPYCDSPTYFDPFPENVNPIGRMDVGDTAAVTTDGITMGLTITAEGNPDTQYPGFFPQGGDGGTNDQPKGIELAEGDAATITLTNASGNPAPLFYSQWIFTDVDQPAEGFTVTPNWTRPGQAAAFGGDNSFTFAGTTNLAVELDDTNGVAEVSESINGRVQVDFLGAVTGIDVRRTFPSDGQSGFAVGGGCEAAGAAKVVTSGPTWNGTSFDVTYDLRVRNNLPSSATIQAVITDAIAAVGASFVTSTPEGIDLVDLQLTDDLRDDAFSSITVTGLSTNGGLNLNDNFDGQTDFDLITSGTIAAEENEIITLSVQYTPDLATANWGDCAAGYDYLNQTRVTGTAANVTVSDLSDDGVSARPSDNNGSGGVDDPTPVNFPCPPGALQIVKTVVNGPNGTCPTFANGTVGDGDALQVIVDDTVTYCITVLNPGPGPVFNVGVTDAQAPGPFSMNDLSAGQTQTVSYDVQVDLLTPTLNTATTSGTDANGPVGPESDTALIAVSPKDQPLLEIVKTVVAGPNGTCPSFADGQAGLGPALPVLDGETVTYCISVLNTGPGDAVNVVISDDQAPQDFQLGTLGFNTGETVSYDLVVDIDTTERTNTANANYSGPDGPRDQVSDPAQIDISPLQPVLEIVKTVVPGPNGVCPSFVDGVQGIGTALAVDDRDTVTYCISVRNSGAGIATGVTVSDPQAAAPGTFDVGTLASGAESDIAFDVVVSLTTPTVNTATVTGNGPDGPLDPQSDQAQIAVDALPNPGLQIVKTALRGPGASCPDFDGGTQGLGAPVQFVETEVVTYCITVRNIGPGPATDVVIADDQAPNTFDLNIGNLAVGQSVTRSYDLIVSLQTPQVNTATANGNGLNGPVPEVADPAQINVSLQPDPVLEIVKTVVSGPNGTCPANFDAGTPGDGDALPVLYTDVVTYCISVRNSGLNQATSVTVADTQAPNVLQLGTLDIGQEKADSYDVIVGAATPVLNTATANGNGPNGDLEPASDTALIAPSPQPDPILEIVKTVVSGPNGTCPANFDAGTPGDGDALIVSYGDTVTFCITVRNSGGNAAQNVTVTDAQAPASISLGTIAINAEASDSYDVVVDASTDLVNTATATGTGPNGDLPAASDTAVIAPADAVLEIVKTVVRGPAGTCPAFADGAEGEGDALAVVYQDTVTYCITVRNSGGNAATNVSIVDVQAPGGGFDVGTIPAGAERTNTYDVIVDADTPVRNVATATGQGPNNTDLGPVSDPAIISTSPQLEPVLEIVKTVVPGPAGDCPTFENGVSGPGDALQVEIGDAVTYCIAIRNTGPGVANNVKITDDQSPASPYEVGTLQPGNGQSVSYDVVIGLNTPFINTATVTGSGPTGPLPQDSDDAVIIHDTPAANVSLIHSVDKADRECLTVAKDLNSLEADIQDSEVTWCAKITNAGNVPLINVTLNAPAIGLTDVDVLAPATILMPGESVPASINGTIPRNGLISNATVTGDPADDDGNRIDLAPVTDTDDAEVREAAIHIETTVVLGANGDCDDSVESIRVPEGADVTWCYTVTNTGTVSLLVNRVVDITLGIDVPLPAEDRIMRPDDSVVVSNVSQAPAGGLVNDAKVSGQPLDENDVVLDQARVVEDDDPATVETFLADVAIVKTNSDAGPIVTGTQLTYTLVVTNNGPDEANDVRVTDELPTGLAYVTVPTADGWVCSLDEGERSFTCLRGESMGNGEIDTLTYIGVTNAAAPAGADLVNTAKVTTSTPDSDETNNEDTSTTQTPVPTVPPTGPPGIQYPGPFEPPAAPPVAPPPDEVLGLAITGASSNLLALLSAAMLAIGGMLTVGARRSRDEQ